MKKIIAILLIFCLTLSLAACSSKGISQSRDDTPSYEGEVVGRDLTGEGGARLFTAKTVPLPDPGVKAKMAVRAGDEVFIYAQDDSGENYFYLMGMNSTLSKVELSLYNAVVAMDGESDGTVTLLAQVYDGSYQMEQVNGTEERMVTLPFLSELKDTVNSEEGDRVDKLVVTPQGYLFETSSKVFCCDASGNFIREYGDYMGYFELIKNESEIVLVVGENGGMTFNVLGPDFEIASTYTVPLDLSQISAGSRNGHVFASNGGILYDVDFTTGERIGYSNEYASGETRNFIYLSDDIYFGFHDGECMYYSADGEEGKNVTTLTLATYSSDWALEDMLEAVRKFNGLSSEYRIEIVNYATYDEAETTGAGLQRLNADIISGNTPDIYDLSVLPYRKFSEQGLLEDLYPYFDASSSVKREDLTTSVLDALEYNGALYNLVPAFTVTMMFGPASLASPDTWSVEAFLELANSTDLNLFGPEVTKAKYLRYLLTFTGDTYIDMENASCNLVESTFPAMLAVALKLPDDKSGLDESDGWGLVFTGQQMFQICTGPTPLYLCWADAAYSGNSVLLGFPSRGNGIALCPEINLGMSAQSAYKDGIWSFFEYLLSSSFQDHPPTDTLPVQTEALHAKLERHVEHLNELNNGTGWVDNKLYKMPLDPSAVSLEMALDVINKIDCLDYVDNTLYELILREATPFFQGGITAQQAAENMQSKVSLYLSEQYC